MPTFTPFGWDVVRLVGFCLGVVVIGGGMRLLWHTLTSVPRVRRDRRSSAREFARLLRWWAVSCLLLGSSLVVSSLATPNRPATVGTIGGVLTLAAMVRALFIAMRMAAP